MQKYAALVHDDEFFMLGMRHILQQNHDIYAAVFAPSLKSVAATIRHHSHKFQLLTVDKTLAGADDLKAVKSEFPHLRIVVIGDEGSQDDALAAISAGAHGYVFKKGGPMHVLFGIGNVLNSAIYIPDGIDKAPENQPSPSDKTVEQYALPPRQVDVWRCLSRGMPTKLIARELDISEGTVKIHLKALYKNLSVPNGKAAAALGAVVFK
jgi:DNA-binding NarL/FixJ family response regulator